jgi:selenocysteine lyase/cysteine desulfurase
LIIGPIRPVDVPRRPGWRSAVTEVFEDCRRPFAVGTLFLRAFVSSIPSPHPVSRGLMMQRRSFVKSMTLGLASLNALNSADAAAPSPESASAVTERFRKLREDIKSSAGDAAIWDRFRREILLKPGFIHLNTGSLGCTPRSVLDAISGWMIEIESDPVHMVWGPIGYQAEDVRARAAAFLGAQTDEVALIENTTTGMNMVAEGISPWIKPGDEILTTNHEHPGGMVCWEWLVKHKGVKIVQIPMPAPARDVDQIVELVKKHITPRTRVCSFSHVETITGLRMPLAQISEVTRPRNILLVCDGAQAPGMLKIDVKALGVDTYASSSHKWLLASKGSGLLYIRKEAQDRIQPTALSTGYGTYTAASGTRNVAQLLGHGVAIDIHNAIGREAIEKRCKGLSAYLRKRFGQIPELKLISATDPELTSGIASFSLKKGKMSEIYEQLYKEHQIIVKAVPKAEYNAFRFSTHIYNNEQEIDKTAEILSRILRA